MKLLMRAIEEPLRQISANVDHGVVAGGRVTDVGQVVAGRVGRQHAEAVRAVAGGQLEGVAARARAGGSDR